MPTKKLSPPLALTLALTLALILFGGLGGWAAGLLGLPLPWMLGSLAASAVAVITLQARFPDYSFPQPLRQGFVALIGVMIGTQVSADMLGLAPALPWTMAALVLFIPLSHGGNYLIFRRVGGFDRPTAFCAGTPGGLLESILLSESSGADVRVVTVQQFLRIILVIVSVPFGLSLYLGQPVGSAAGLTLEGAGPVPWTQLPLIVVAAGAGLWVAERIHLPAAPLVGPLVIAAVMTVTGLVDLHLPGWLIALAQVVVGVSLGLRFKGVSLALLRRSAGLAVLSVVFMMALGAALCEALLLLTGIPFLHLFISFAPGGVTEMSLVALSLAANPALVSLHHVARILLTVVEMSIAARWLGIAKT